MQSSGYWRASKLLRPRSGVRGRASKLFVQWSGWRWERGAGALGAARTFADDLLVARQPRRPAQRGAVQRVLGPDRRAVHDRIVGVHEALLGVGGRRGRLVWVEGLDDAGAAGVSDVERRVEGEAGLRRRGQVEQPLALLKLLCDEQVRHTVVPHIEKAEAAQRRSHLGGQVAVCAGEVDDGDLGREREGHGRLDMVVGGWCTRTIVEGTYSSYMPKTARQVCVCVFCTR